MSVAAMTCEASKPAVTCVCVRVRVCVCERVRAGSRVHQCYNRLS